MNIGRAKEIMKSGDSVEVLYHGYPVWIENITADNCAEVRFVDDCFSTTIPVERLSEKHRLR